MADATNTKLSPCAKDLTGKRFGRLTVVAFSHRVWVDPEDSKKGTDLFWKCICECGVEKVASRRALQCGRTNSCGCINRERITKHGRANTPEYHAWEHMLQRCLNINDKRYADYGGRGITVCDSWNAFENFITDMGPRPSAKHSLDRFPDMNGNYCKDNCRWATATEQQRNTRTNTNIQYQGKSMCLTAWAEELHLSCTALRTRLARGRTPETGLFAPLWKKQ